MLPDPSFDDCCDRRCRPYDVDITPADPTPPEPAPPTVPEPVPAMAPVDDGDPGPSPPDEEPPPPPPPADAGPAPDDEVDLHDLVDAPSHTDQIIERLTEAFPGAELHVNEPSEEHQ